MFEPCAAIIVTLNAGPGYPGYSQKLILVELMLKLEVTLPPEGRLSEVELNPTVGQFEPGQTPPPETVPDRVTLPLKPPKLLMITELGEPRTPRLIGRGFPRDKGPTGKNL